MTYKWTNDQFGKQIVTSQQLKLSQEKVSLLKWETVHQFWEWWQIGLFWQKCKYFSNFAYFCHESTIFTKSRFSSIECKIEVDPEEFRFNELRDEDSGFPLPLI